MATQLILVPAGTVNGPFPLAASQNLCAGPAVLGGTVLIETGPSQTGPFTGVPGGASLFALSVARAQSPVLTAPNVWARVTAAVAAGVVAISDMGAGPNSVTGPFSEPLINLNAAIASPSTASEVVLFSFRLPAGFLKPNFRIDMDGLISFTNSANAKTSQIRMNGLAGSLIFQSSALANNANLRFRASLMGIGDGLTLKGGGSGLTSVGLGISSTAIVTLARDYMNNETEIVVTCTKATAAETFQIDSLVATLYQ